MAQDSKIAWTKHTVNLWWGCVEVAPECDECYAREWAKRYDRAKWGAKEPRLFIKSALSNLAKFQRLAATAGRVDNVFVGSMMDIGELAMPVVSPSGDNLGLTTGDLRDFFFKEVVPQSPNLQFLLLSKRPSNYSRIVPPAWLENPPSNVVYGTTAGTVATAAKNIPALLEIPGRHFVSAEPLLEAIRLDAIRLPGNYEFDALRGIRRGLVTRDIQYGLGKIDWLVTGCESRGRLVGRNSDAVNDHMHDLVQQCQAAGVPVLVKQVAVGGQVIHDTAQFPANLRVQEFLPALPFNLATQG